MIELLLHLLGDYVTQTNWMANRKRAHLAPAAIHALVYALPFLLLQPSALGWWIICISHFLIDHFGLARYLVFAKNWVTEPHLRWRDCSATGYPPSTPVWLATWLTIIADNFLHLAINYWCLRWV